MNWFLDFVFVVDLEPTAHFPHGCKHITAHAFEALKIRHGVMRKKVQVKRIRANR